MLSIVSTPIGNLKDITLRAVETLRQCDMIICEDTRVTGILLKHLEIPKKELISLHGYSDPRKVDDVITKIEQGTHACLVSDAGTPGISDPGYALVSRCRERGVRIEAVPGPSAFLAALSVSGLPINHFRYFGFLPLKKGRQTLLRTFVEMEETIVFYESVHRIEKTMNELADVLKDQPDRPVVICRELTKMYEETLNTRVDQLAALSRTVAKKGEFVVMIGAYDGRRGKRSE